MDNLHQRLVNAFEFLTSIGETRTQKIFADKIGKHETQVSSALKNRPKYCTMGLMVAIADAFPNLINREYMLNGIGDVRNKNSVLSLPDAEAYLRMSAEAMNKPIKKIHIPISASAGSMDISIGSASESECELFTLNELFGSDYDSTMTAMGDSMEPTIGNNDFVMCRKVYGVHEIKNGEIYVVGTKSGAIIKRLKIKGGKITAYSDNPKYKPFQITDEITDILKVVGVMKRF